MRQENLLLYCELLQTALKASASLMLFCTFGILALGGVGVNLLYGHGDFSSSDVSKTLLCLWGYGFGLIPSGFVLLLANGFYAQKSYGIPTFASVLSVAANIVLNGLFVFGFGWGAVSIAIATSASALINAAVLALGLKKRMGAVFGLGNGWFFLKAGLSCALPAAAVSLIGNLWVGGLFPRSISLQLFQCSVLSSIYIGGVSLIGWKLGMENLLKLFKRKSMAPL
jgi:putative peptidoglycan lipid II flippase